MKNSIKLMKKYIAYYNDKSNSLALGHRWTAETFTAVLDKLENKRIPKIGEALFNKFLSLSAVEQCSCNIGDYSKTRLMRIVGALNSKTEKTRKKKIKKIWDDYCETFLAKYEIMSALRNPENEQIIIILDYVDGWKSKEKRQEILNERKTNGSI